MLHRSVMLAGVLALAMAAPAAAQRQPEPPAQSIGGGVQWVYPFEGGSLSGTPGAQASWRRWFGPNLGVEGAFGWWRRSSSIEFYRTRPTRFSKSRYRGSERTPANTGSTAR